MPLIHSVIFSHKDLDPAYLYKINPNHLIQTVHNNLNTILCSLCLSELKEATSLPVPPLSKRLGKACLALFCKTVCVCVCLLLVMGLRHQRVLMKRPSDAWILSRVLRRLSAASAPVAAQQLCRRPSSLKELRYFRENLCILYVRGKRVFHLVLLKKWANLPMNISSLCIYCIPEKCSSNQSESNSSLITIKAKPVYGKPEESQLLRLHPPPQSLMGSITKANQCHRAYVCYPLC